MLNRSDTLSLVHASLHAQRPDYARRLADNWIEAWPGDTGLKLLLARAHIAQHQETDAVRVLQDLEVVDPENFQAHELLASVYEALGDSQSAIIAQGLADIPSRVSLPRLPWLVATRESWTAIGHERWDAARDAAERALQSDPPSPLPALLMLKSLWLSNQIDLAFPLAQGFYDRWPTCVAVNLCLAESLLHTGDYTRGVHLLHGVVALDPSSEITNRYWDHDHAYRPIWPPEPRISAPGPTPPEVAAQLGTNRLGYGQHNQASPPYSRHAAHAASHQHGTIGYQVSDEVTEVAMSPAPPPRSEHPATLSTPTTTPDELRDIEHELDKVRTQVTRWSTNGQSNNIPSNQLQPVHIVLTNKTLLENKYDQRGAERILTLLGLLVQKVEQFANRPGVIVMADTAHTLTPYGLDPVDPTNPGEIKTLIQGLNTALAVKSQTIGSLLLVGGDDVVPFHRLPNPTDDHDSDVPSDNPYGTSDSNYFIPEWPVGRLATPTGDDPGPLINLIQRTIRAYGAPKYRLPILLRWLSWIFPKWNIRFNASRSTSRGLTADIWRDASLEVFSTIGHPRDLYASPPLQAPDLPQNTLSPIDLSYFNLHGLEDAPDWYGQSTTPNGQGSRFPLALRPGDIRNNGHAPTVVFTEACYGANILDKHRPESAMCLRFLAAGSHAVVGATKVAYGSVGSPLVGADLLGRYFWESVLAGLPVGEALRRAKLGVAHTMHDRQGFLDGEDQKTLISFVLYGDPLLIAPNMLPTKRPPLPKSIAMSSPVLHPTCAKSHCTTDELGNHDIMEHVKELVTQYLPSMEQCEVRVGKPHGDCDGNGHECLTSSLGSKSPPQMRRGQLVYTLSREIHVNNHTKHQYAHVTVNKAGKVLKLSVSR